MDLNFSFSGLFAGFAFGVFGFSLLRYGKKQAHAPHIIIGIVLMVYPYFIGDTLLLWGIGIGLLGLAYKLR